MGEEGESKRCLEDKSGLELEVAKGDLSDWLQDCLKIMFSLTLAHKNSSTMEKKKEEEEKMIQVIRIIMLKMGVSCRRNDVSSWGGITGDKKLDKRLLWEVLGHAFWQLVPDYVERHKYVNLRVIDTSQCYVCRKQKNLIVSWIF